MGGLSRLCSLGVAGGRTKIGQSTCCKQTANEKRLICDIAAAIWIAGCRARSFPEISGSIRSRRRGVLPGSFTSVYFNSGGILTVLLLFHSRIKINAEFFRFAESCGTAGD